MSTALAHPLQRPSAASDEVRTYTVTFTTPAFLGNANQQAQWRTPPFKHLIREWWRVVKATELINARQAAPENVHLHVRAAESQLFGHAWAKEADPQGAEARRSQVRLRLSDWGVGKEWDKSEVGPRIQVAGERNAFNAFIYAGFGPLSTKGKEFVPRSAIEAGRSARLDITAPAERWRELDPAIALIHRFGAVGSRSRNGWGSVVLSPVPSLPALKQPAPQPICWPHALGRVWRCRTTAADWKSAMTECARTRKVINLSVDNPKGRFGERHVLSDPVTKNDTPAGGSGARLASQLRLKVARDGNALRVYAYHLVCTVPGSFSASAPPALQQAAWQKVHAALDRLMEPVQ